MNNNRVISVENLEQAMIKFAKGLEPKAWIKNKDWGTKWGKNNRYRATFSLDQKVATVYDHKTGIYQTYSLRNSNYSNGTYPNGDDTSKNFNNYKQKPKPEFKDHTDDFNRLKDFTNFNHKYLKDKQVSLKGIKGIKQDTGGNIVIPICSVLDDSKNIIISTQTIYPNGNKLFAKGVLGNGIFFQIGDNNFNKPIYLAEGLSTSLSIHRITGCMVYMCFSNKHIDNVLSYLLREYIKQKIVLCLDYDKR